MKRERNSFSLSASQKRTQWHRSHGNVSDCYAVQAEEERKKERTEERGQRKKSLSLTTVSIIVPMIFRLRCSKNSFKPLSILQYKECNKNQRQ
jgi:hypothetical protein